MAPLLNALLVATIAAGGLAAAIPARVGTTASGFGGGSFSVGQVRNARFVRHGPIALAKAYHKYGVSIPNDLASAVAGLLQKRETGSETATPMEYDVEYLTPVSIGSPPQVLNLDFDSGSSDLWVFSSETPKGSVNGQALYDPSKSSSSKELSGASWSITYGDGSACSGNVFMDKVTVGGLTVESQAVEAARQVSSSFTSDSDNDGLLGLAFSSINTVSPTPQKTFFDNALSSLDSPVFTSDLKHDAPGKYNFGFIDKTAYNGSIAYTPVDSSDGFWTFTSSGYGVGEGDFSSSRIVGIADTGTTLLLLPTAVVKDYYAGVRDAEYDSTQGGYVFPCDADLPTFIFGVGEERITIPGDYVNFAPLEDGSSACFGGIQDNTGIGFAIFGDIALKAAFVVFDAGEEQLGWAAKKVT